MSLDKSASLYFFIACAVVFYVLAGIALNPLIVWTALPLYVGYWLIHSDRFGDSKQGRYSSYSFVAISVGFSLFYHLTWFFDWQGTQTSSSTSGLIFLFMPIYAVIFGLVGFFSGSLIGGFLDRKSEIDE